VKNRIESFLSTVVQQKIYKSEPALLYHLESIFQGVDLAHKRVLEIGGGAGVYSFYAAIQGAKEVVCLEPEAAGSAASISKTFKFFALLRVKNSICHEMEWKKHQSPEV